MGARALLTLLLCGACTRDGRVAEIPGFASQLPGRAAVVAWSRGGTAGGTTATELPAGLERLLSMLPLEPSASEACRALQSPARVKVGWAKLADSPGFREALGILPQGFPKLLYVDLQQLLAALPEHPGLGLLGRLAKRKLEQVLRLSDLRYLALGLQREGTGWHGQGRIQTTGTSHGLPGLWRLPTPVPVLRRARAGSLQLELAFDPASLQALSKDLLALEGGLAGMLGGGATLPGRISDVVMPHLTGRLSFFRDDAARGGSRTVLELGLRDGQGLREELGELGLGRALGALLGSRRVRLLGDRLVVSSPAGLELPGGPGTPIGGAAFLSLRLDGSSLLVRRISEDAYAVELHLR